MSNTFALSRSSSAVSRSNSSVPSPAVARTSATKRLRGLRRLLPLPWAKTTIPGPPPGVDRCPASRAGPAGITTSPPQGAAAGPGTDPPARGEGTPRADEGPPASGNEPPAAGAEPPPGGEGPPGADTGPPGADTGPPAARCSSETTSLSL